ncbi:hypothetical protein SAMN05428952_100931 [Nitrosomonas sp. Nm132]|nr:hypothetical protein SAMN05428952_100931 [Nitrosomonas sp. Nm132]
MARCQRFKGRSPIEYLFDKLDMLYPNRWRGQFKSPEDHENWCQCWGEELDERNVTFDEVKRGLARCIELYDWPPSFPEFLKACRPALDYETAFHEAVEQMRARSEGKDRWSNPAIYWAAAKLGGDIMNTVYINVKGRWKAALDEAIHNVATGISPREVPKRPVLIEYNKPSNIKSEVAQRELEKMKKIMEQEPAWKRNLRERGMTYQSPDVGLKHVTEHLEIKERVA